MKHIVLIILMLAFVFSGESAPGDTHRKAFSLNPETPKVNPNKKVGLPKSSVSVGLPKPANTERTVASLTADAPADKEEAGSDGRATKTKKYADGQATRYTERQGLDKGARGKCVKNADGTWTLTRKGKSKVVQEVDPAASFAKASHRSQNVNYAQAHGLNSVGESGGDLRAFALNESFRNWVQPDNQAATDYYYYTTEADRQAVNEGRDFLVAQLGVRMLGNGECSFEWGGGGGGGGAGPATNNGKGASGKPL